MGHEDMAGADTAPAVTTQPDGLGRPSPQWAVGHEDSHFSLSPRRPRVRLKLQDQVRGPVLRACCPPDPVPGPRQGGTNVGCPLCFYHGCPPPPLGSTQRQVPSGPTPGPVSCSGHLSRLPPPSRLSQRSSALFNSATAEATASPRTGGRCWAPSVRTMASSVGPGIPTQVSLLPAGALSTQGGSSPAHEGQAGSDGRSGGLGCMSKGHGVNGDVSC